jgi:hypothetical protein
LWLDPDVRWLTGVHEADGHAYLVRESYEELLWWLQMPSLLRVASELVPNRAEIDAMGRSVEEALAAAEAVGYRVDLLIGPDHVEAEDSVAEAGTDSPSGDVASVLEESRKAQVEREIELEIEPEEVKVVLSVEPDDAQ